LAFLEPKLIKLTYSRSKVRKSETSFLIKHEERPRNITWKGKLSLRWVCIFKFTQTWEQLITADYCKRRWLQKFAVLPYFAIQKKPNFRKLRFKNWVVLSGYINVGDGCWRRNVLMTILRCCWPNKDIGDQFITWKKSPT